MEKGCFPEKLKRCQEAGVPGKWGVPPPPRGPKDLQAGIVIFLKQIQCKGKECRQGGGESTYPGGVFCPSPVSAKKSAQVGRHHQLQISTRRLLKM